MRRWSLLAAALVGGAFVDTGPEPEVIRRGDYQVLHGDFHVHTRLSDGVLSPLDVVMAARRARLDVVAVTEHNTVAAGRAAAAFAELVGGPIVIVGQEITTRDYHVIALGLTETIPGGLPISAALMAVRRQKGVSIAAHPVRRFWPVLDRALPLLDGAEVMHPLVRRSDHAWRGDDLEKFYARLVSARPHAAAIGSSDHHALNGLGSCRTLLFVREASAEGVMEALRAGRTVVVHDDGRMTGDAEMVALLESEPVEASAPPSYRATSLLDAVLRTVGLVGVVLVVFTRRPRSRTRADERSAAI